MEDQNLVQDNKPELSWSVAVVAPASEVEGVIHTLYTRQFYLQVIIGLVVLSGTIVMSWSVAVVARPAKWKG